MYLKLISSGSTFLLKSVGVLIEAAPGSVFEDSGLLLVLAQDSDLRNLVEAGTVIVNDGTDLSGAAGLQYLTRLWTQGGDDLAVRPPSALSTGILRGGLLSVNALDDTKFDITEGCGIIVDGYSDPDKPTLSYVSWPAQAGVADPHIAASTETFIYIDKFGNFVFTTTAPTGIEYRDAIHIGWTSHPDYTVIYDAYTEPVLAADPLNQLEDFMSAFGPFNVSGNVYGPEIGLKIQRDAGDVFDSGSNYKNNPKNPHVVGLSAEVPVVDLWYFYRDPGDPAGWNNSLPAVTDIDPNHYDDGTGVLASVPAGKFTVQLITLYAPWNVTDIQYGQFVYDTLVEAVERISIDTPELNPWNSDWDVLRGWLIVQQGTVDLTNVAQAQFLAASRFGSVIGSGGGGGGGEVNTASNQGTAGIGVFLSKIGVDLGFKNIRAASTKITVANNAGQKTVDVDLGAHKTTHENGGPDQMTVAGLTGLLGTPQTPASHTHASHTGIGENDHHNRQHALTSASDHTGTLDDTMHGSRSGGALHAAAVAGVSAGFMSAVDKTKVDALLTVQENGAPITGTPHTGLNFAEGVLAENLGAGIAKITGALVKSAFLELGVDASTGATAWTDVLTLNYTKARSDTDLLIDVSSVLTVTGGNDKHARLQLTIGGIAARGAACVGKAGEGNTVAICYRKTGLAAGAVAITLRWYVEANTLNCRPATTDYEHMSISVQEILP